MIGASKSGSKWPQDLFFAADESTHFRRVGYIFQGIVDSCSTALGKFSDLKDGGFSAVFGGFLQCDN
jgi:hypothetical protein